MVFSDKLQLGQHEKAKQKFKHRQTGKHQNLTNSADWRKYLVETLSISAVRLMREVFRKTFWPSAITVVSDVIILDSILFSLPLPDLCNAVWLPDSFSPFMLFIERVL